jgi:hypothetical protein
MNKKILTQCFLVLVIVVSVLVFYNIFFKYEPSQLESVKKETLDIPKKNTNLINNITYNSKSLGDNNYTIKAEFAEIDKDKPDFMVLTNVKGKFLLKNSDLIEITSKKANYNSVNYNTNFYQDVLITFEDHQINSDNFDLLFDKNLGTIYNNIVYKNLSTTLIADKIDIDLITKDSKIYMIDKSKNIKIKHLN